MHRWHMEPQTWPQQRIGGTNQHDGRGGHRHTDESFTTFNNGQAQTARWGVIRACSCVGNRPKKNVEDAVCLELEELLEVGASLVVQERVQVHHRADLGRELVPAHAPWKAAMGES